MFVNFACKTKYVTNRIKIIKHEKKRSDSVDMGAKNVRI